MKSYISNNANKILCIYLLSLAVAAFIPSSVFAALPTDRLLDSLPDNYQRIGISALMLFLIALLKERAGRQWGRYRNTVGAVWPNFSYHDYLVWFLSFSVLLLLLKQFVGFRTFAGVGAAAAITITLLTLLKGDAGAAEAAKDVNWFSDEPIRDEKRDLLGRVPFVQRLYDQVTSLPFTDSFVFGLSGGLGEGKTSVINLLKNKFKANGTYLIVDYDPWHFADEKAMLLAFYNEVENTISKNLIVPGFKRTLAKYQKLLSPEISPFGVKLGFKVDESLEDIKERIEGHIKRTRKKLLIIVDDLDRLLPGEILAVLKLIRLNAKFENTIFILAVDRNRVREKLSTVAGVDDEYLEKFVQRDVVLPAADYKSIENFLDAHLEKLFSEINVSPEEKKAFEDEFVYLYQTHISRLFKNLRKTKIYLNSLRAALPPIRKEVNLFDFCVLELIKVFYPKVYADIWQHPEFYIPFGWDDDRHLRSPFLFDDDDDEKYQRIKSHVEGVIEGESETDVVRKMLAAIFPVYVKQAVANYRSGAGLTTRQTYRLQRRITHPESFVKYFMLDVPTLDIGDEELYAKLEQWRAAEEGRREGLIAESFFEYQKQKKLALFLKKLNMFSDRIPGELIRPIIRATYKNADKFSNEFGGLEYFFRSEWDKAHSLLIWLINDHVERGEIQATIEEAALNTAHLPFAVLLVADCARQSQGSLYNIYNAVNVEELKAKLSDRLKRHYVDSGVNIFDEYPEGREWTLIIYRWATNWQTNTGDNRRIVNDYIAGLYESGSGNLMRVVEHCLHFTNAAELRAVYDVDRVRAVVERYLGENKLNDEERSVAERFLTAHLPALPDGGAPLDGIEADDISDEEI